MNIHPRFVKFLLLVHHLSTMCSRTVLINETLTIPMIYEELEKTRGASASKISSWTGVVDGVNTYAKKWSRRIAVGTVNSRETISARSFPWPLFSLDLLGSRRKFLCSLRGSRLPLRQQEFFSLGDFYVPGWMYLEIFSCQVFPSGALPSYEKLSLCLRFPIQDFREEARHINRRCSLNFEWILLLHIYRSFYLCYFNFTDCWNDFKSN